MKVTSIYYNNYIYCRPCSIYYIAIWFFIELLVKFVFRNFSYPDNVITIDNRYMLKILYETLRVCKGYQKQLIVHLKDKQDFAFFIEKFTILQYSSFTSTQSLLVSQPLWVAQY